MGSLAGKAGEPPKKDAAASTTATARERGSDQVHDAGCDDAGLSRHQISASWKGGPTVLAFLFAQPDSAAIQTLDARGEYFDVRTGETWDLFFPGYYRSQDGDARTPRTVSAGGCQLRRELVLQSEDFNRLRDHVRGNVWTDAGSYSGGADLVLINGMLVEKGEPVIDWVSTQGWDITDSTADGQTLTLAKVVESITRDFETNAEDESYGLRKDGPPSSGGSSVTRDFMIDTVREIAVALGLKLAGL